MKLAAAAFLSAALLSAPAFAQTTDAAPPPPPGMQGHHGGPGMHGMPMAMGTHVAPVSNAPFSAKFTLESVQTAPGPDGLVRKVSTTQSVYRDSLGRTREDITLPVPPPRPLKQAADGTPIAPKTMPAAPRTLTVIEDPVANTVTRLNPDKKTAVVETVPAEFFKHSIDSEAKQAAGEHPRHMNRGAGSDGTAPPPDAPITTDLGSKTFSGVVASGRRTTHTFPAREGDAASTPRTMTHEAWYSPDLKLEVSSTETSPRGTRSDVLTSLTKAEPDASLFKVPDGYTVTTATPHGPMHHGAPGAPLPPPAM